MGDKRTHAIHRAADQIDATVAALGQMRMMPHADARTEARRTRLANAAPDIQAMRPHITMSMADELAKLDERRRG